MRSLFPVTVCCISLLSLQQQPLALPVGSRLDRNRLSFLQKLQEYQKGESVATGTVASPAASIDYALEAKRDWLKLLLFKGPPPREGGDVPMLSSTLPQAEGAPEIKKRGPRGRRHIRNAARGHHHPQLMRVGCVLGTCQVQNLSHRLYQLIGQSGREDSSPINPKSPHSYG
ncbi:hypothetical protein MATL_G00263370 [Megalops atlanticus]|uniref:Uncharacterized protein n=1 Tax=Megalops atlanticus TaxID=7932 RepID=A0A9D3P9A3_MEGAT|nr:hypothetical protein MATL_G00263370 [Megalops atlanticus]